MCEVVQYLPLGCEQDAQKGSVTRHVKFVPLDGEASCVLEKVTRAAADELSPLDLT